MKYITAEQFLKANKEVQKAILKWWKPSVGDLVYDKDNIIDVVVPNLCIGDYKDNLDKNKVIPLLTEGQLREFIEDITNSTVLTEFMFSTKDYSIICFENEKEYKYLFDNLGDNLLQALWQVANEIIK